MKRVKRTTANGSPAPVVASAPPVVTAVLNLHREGYLCAPAIKSLRVCCDEARARGHVVEAIAVLDRADERTRGIVQSDTSLFDRVLEVDHGDLGASRNTGREASHGRYVAFFDADDMWGRNWLSAAIDFSEAHPTEEAILHPEYVYYFNATDFLNQSHGKEPLDGYRSFFFRHIDSASPDFDARVIAFNNIYTSNSFASHDVYKKYPYVEIEHERGFGVEDWGWNAETLAAGVRHAVVPSTAHLVRVKESGSLGASNAAAGLLPPLHLVARKLGRQAATRLRKK